MSISPEEVGGLVKVLRYYSFFRYAPTTDDIHGAYPYKVSRAQMVAILAYAVKEERILIEKVAGTSYYTMPPHGISLHEIERKRETTEEKLKHVSMFLSLLKYIAPVYLIGLSGSLAMNNAGKNDDIDLFVISSPNSVWTTRILLLLLASLLGLRRKRGEKSPSGKVCLNLFFDGSDLAVPKQKRNLYIAHEILHMKPLLSRGDMYDQFLHANAWVKEILPNFSAKRVNHSFIIPFPLLNLLEQPFKKLQQSIIQKHRTNELVSDTQMWFYPDDFEQKLRRSKLL